MQNYYYLVHHKNSNTIYRNYSVKKSDFQNDDQIFSYIILLDHFILNIEYSIMVIFNKKINQIKLKVSFFKNNKLIKVSDKALNLLICRYFNKINAILRYGHFRTNPFTKQFYLEIINMISEKQYRRFIQDTNPANQYIFQAINQCYELIKKYVLNILYRIGQIEEIILDNKILQYKKLQNGLSKFNLIDKKKNSQQNNKHERLRTQQNEILQRITSIGCISILDILKENQIQNNNTWNLNIVKQNNQKYNNILQYYDIQDIDIKQFKTMIMQIIQHKQKFNKYLLFPKFDNKNQFDIKILTHIIVTQYQAKNKKIINETAFSTIYQMKLKFAYNTFARKLKNQYNQLTFAIKQHKQNSNITKQDQRNIKIVHEKKILQTIQDLSCIYITKFYQTNKQQLKSALIMNLYMFGSLNQYLNKNSRTISLMAKIFLLCQLLQGLRFLRNNKIVHLDIKLQNILIGKELLLKLSDFGQSYHPSVCKKNFNPAFTFPYVAPEFFYDKPNYNQKMDVYSLGIVMYELFFGRLLIESRNIGHEKLIEYYQERINTNKYWHNNKILLSEDNLHFYGPEKLMQTLAYLCLKCTRTEQSQRPLLDWILIQLRESINFLDKVY